MMAARGTSRQTMLILLNLSKSCAKLTDVSRSFGPLSSSSFSSVYPTFISRKNVTIDTKTLEAHLAHQWEVPWQVGAPWTNPWLEDHQKSVSQAWWTTSSMTLWATTRKSTKLPLIQRRKNLNKSALICNLSRSRTSYRPSKASRSLIGPGSSTTGRTYGPSSTASSAWPWNQSTSSTSRVKRLNWSLKLVPLISTRCLLSTREKMAQLKRFNLRGRHITRGWDPIRMPGMATMNSSTLRKTKWSSSTRRTWSGWPGIGGLGTTPRSTRREGIWFTLTSTKIYRFCQLLSKFCPV